MVTGSNPVLPIKENTMTKAQAEKIKTRIEYINRHYAPIKLNFKMLLADSELFDMLAEKLDYPDEMLIELREDVNNYMEDVV